MRSSLKRRTGRALWRPMVSWFNPDLLLRILAQVVVARLFGRYADRRERIPAEDVAAPFRYDDGDEVRVDFVADIGDGWNSTATVASLIAADALDVGGENLPHARVLVMGGDEVYPAGSREAYLARLEAPYYSLHPYSRDESPRDIFALPGNHDWYDGLATFARLFMQGRWFAGWKTRQSRSYFVLRLPQRWWLVAADVQLDNDIDKAQIDYLLSATAEMKPGDAVILTAATPWWLEEPDSILRRNIAFLERKLVTERGASVRLALAGDLHHYQRHAGSDGSQRIVSGGGGAFLHGTAWQYDAPADAVVDAASDDDGYSPSPQTGANKSFWKLAALFPSPLASRVALWRLAIFPLLNPGFSLLLGGIFTLLMWGIDSSSNGIFFANADVGVMSVVAIMDAATGSPLVALSLLALFMAGTSFVEPPRRLPPLLHGFFRGFAGVAHVSAHLLAALVVLVNVGPSRLENPLVFFSALAETWLWLSLACGVIFGAYLFLTYQLLGFHQETAFAACRIEHAKHFLRLHIDRDGALTVNVIGIPRICRSWRERKPVVREDACVEAADGLDPSARAVLVEKVRISPHA